MALINIVVVHHRLSPHAGMPIRMPANVNLEGMTLVERLFEGMILPHWNFDGATLTGSTLRKCQLSDCTFKAVDAPNVTFDQIEAKGLIDLTGARLVGGHFKDIVPAETFLYSRADLTAALFEGACWSATKENRFHNAILAACAGLPFGTSNENFDRVDLSALKLPGMGGQHLAWCDGIVARIVDERSVEMSDPALPNIVPLRAETTEELQSLTSIQSLGLLGKKSAFLAINHNRGYVLRWNVDTIQVVPLPEGIRLAALAGDDEILLGKL
jgi:uncharacterized protein YjbI with pentapeptide repeats